MPGRNCLQCSAAALPEIQLSVAEVLSLNSHQKLQQSNPQLLPLKAFIEPHLAAALSLLF